MTKHDIPRNRAVRYAEYRVDVPFLDYLDILVEPDAEPPCLVVDLEHKHLNGAGQAHGGLLTTLLDMAMASAARSTDLHRRSCVTVEMKTNFLRPGGGSGGRLSARGRLRHASMSLAFCEGDLVDEQGRLVATASGVFKFVKLPDDDAP